MTASLRRAAGSLLVVGLGGTELTGLERAWLKLVRPAGIILFKRNIADALQTRALLHEAAGLGGARGLRCVPSPSAPVTGLRAGFSPWRQANVARTSRLLTRPQLRPRPLPARL